MLRHRGMRPGRRLGISLAPDARPWSGYRPAQPGRRCDDVIETGGLLGPLSSVTSNASRMGSASLSSFLNACFRLAVKRLSVFRARGPATARQIVAETRWSRFSNAVTGQSTSRSGARGFCSSEQPVDALPSRQLPGVNLLGFRGSDHPPEVRSPPTSKACMAASPAGIMRGVCVRSQGRRGV